MKKCAILFLLFLAVLVFAASVEKNYNEKENFENAKGQELTLLNKN